MPKGYVVVTEVIHDAAGMDAYMAAAGASMVTSGAKILVVDPKPDVLEGDWHGDRTIVMEFESVEAAHAWYKSPEYQKAMPLRHAAAESKVAILAGFEMPS